MTLRATTALVLFIDSGDLTPSLPDPTTVSGRVHWVANANLSNITVSSTGATPFVESGQNAVTIMVAPGQAKFLQSDGVRWKVLASLGSRRIFSGTGVTDASGNVTLTFTPSFPSVPVISNAVESAATDIMEGRITALSASSVTINVRRSPTVVVLGISVLGSPAPAVGVSVHVTAIEGGQGV